MVQKALKSVWSFRKSNKIFIGEDSMKTKMVKTSSPSDFFHACFNAKMQSAVEPVQDRINRENIQLRKKAVSFGEKICVKTCHYNTSLKQNNDEKNISCVKTRNVKKNENKSCAKTRNVKNHENVDEKDNKSKSLICRTPKTIRRRAQSLSEIESINTLKDWDVYTMVRKHSEERKRETLCSAKIIYDAHVPIEIPKYSMSNEIDVICRTRHKRRNAVHIYDREGLKEQLTYYVVQMQFAVRFGL